MGPAPLRVVRGGRPMHAWLGTAPLPPDRPLVVLVHGAVVSSRYMMPLLHALDPHVRVLAPDLPGHGRSRRLPFRGMHAQADALLDWLDALEVERAAFVGNSYGCQVIASFAARHPDRTSCVVLQGPTGERRSLARLLFGLGMDSLQKVFTRHGLNVLLDLRDCGLRRAWALAREMRRRPGDDLLPFVDRPALVVRGTRDWYVTRAWCEHVARLLPRGRHVEIPGGDHTLNFTRPARLASLILPFVLGATTRAPTPVGAAA
ncbi:MAG: alpha/beta hydrolase [Planctomycetes bacterium]|nr:alpha/beta hydrolase [Planctomycetota bacterium]